MGEIRALCISEKRGTQKHALDRVFFMTEHGIDGDAHAGDWHRQVSLLGLGEIDDFRARGADVDFGAFGENVVAEGFRFKELPLGTRLRVGDVFLEITQIGKECHSHCQIYHQVGDCIMPREGVFARVLHGGGLVGLGLELQLHKHPSSFVESVGTTKHVVELNFSFTLRKVSSGARRHLNVSEHISPLHQVDQLGEAQGGQTATTACLQLPKDVAIAQLLQ